MDVMDVILCIYFQWWWCVICDVDVVGLNETNNGLKCLAYTAYHCQRGITAVSDLICFSAPVVNSSRRSTAPACHHIISKMHINRLDTEPTNLYWIITHNWSSYLIQQSTVVFRLLAVVLCFCPGDRLIMIKYGGNKTPLITASNLPHLRCSTTRSTADFINTWHHGGEETIFPE